MRERQVRLIGERVRFHRDARRKTQAVVAGLVGISEDYLSQVERGLKTPSLGTLQRIAETLDVPAVALLDDPPKRAETASGTYVELRRAMFAPWLEASARGTPDVERLGLWVKTIWSRWQSSSTRYTETASVLPGLVVEAEAAMRAFRAPGEADVRRRACEVTADLYFLVRSFCKRTGQLDLTLIAADRGIRAAEESGDPPRVAASHWNLCHALLASGEVDRAELVALEAARTLDRLVSTAYQPDAVALLGALNLVAAESIARRGDSESARRRLREDADKAASLAGERSVCWTAFGPTNVRMHAVRIEILAGQVHTALQVAGRVDSSRSASIERRLTFQLELARCHEQRGEDAAVLDRLLDAEKVASEDLRHNTLARELVGGLVTRARRSSAPSIHQLATRIGLIPS